MEEYKRYVGNGMSRLAERFSPEDWHTPERVRAILDEFMPYYNAHKGDRTAPYPGVCELLKRLKEAGVTMAVLSNKAHSLVPEIIEGYFPQTFAYVQASAENVLFVGDSNVDIRTAKNGGLTSCGVLWGFRSQAELEEEGAVHLARPPDELEALILHGPVGEERI